MRIRRRGGNPYPDGKPVKAVVKKIAGKWYVTVCYAVEEPHEDETPLAAAATQAGQQAQELAAPDKPKDRGQGRHRVCREPEHGGHDALCQGDSR